MFGNKQALFCSPYCFQKIITQGISLNLVVVVYDSLHASVRMMEQFSVIRWDSKILTDMTITLHLPQFNYNVLPVKGTDYK